VHGVRRRLLRVCGWSPRVLRLPRRNYPQLRQEQLCVVRRGLCGCLRLHYLHAL
jgi:hypothetical protein